jgi:hypothetical protein
VPLMSPSAFWSCFFATAASDVKGDEKKSYESGCRTRNAGERESKRPDGSGLGVPHPGK